MIFIDITIMLGLFAASIYYGVVGGDTALGVAFAGMATAQAAHIRIDMLKKRLGLR